MYLIPDWLKIFQHFQNSNNPGIENVRNLILRRAWKDKKPRITAKTCNENWCEKSKLYELITTDNDRDVIVAESGNWGIIFVCDGQSLKVRHVLDVTNLEDPAFVQIKMSVAENFLVAFVCLNDYKGVKR